MPLSRNHDPVNQVLRAGCEKFHAATIIFLQLHMDEKLQCVHLNPRPQRRRTSRREGGGDETDVSPTRRYKIRWERGQNLNRVRFCLSLRGLCRATRNLPFRGCQAPFVPSDSDLIVTSTFFLIKLSSVSSFPDFSHSRCDNKLQSKSTLLSLCLHTTKQCGHSKKMELWLNKNWQRHLR